MMSKMILASLAFVATTAELTEYGRLHGLKEVNVPVTQGATCVDKGIPAAWHRYVPDCATAKARGNCNRPGYTPFSKAYCAQTCGYCDASCEDSEIPETFAKYGPDCDGAQKKGNCESFSEFAAVYCPKTCNLCPADEGTDDFDAEDFEAEDFMDTLNELATLVGQADLESSEDQGEFMDLLADVADQLEFPEQDEDASVEEDAEFVELLAKIAADLTRPTEGEVAFEEEVIPMPGDSAESDEELVPFFTDFMDQISDLADQLSELETPELEMLANMDPEDVPINPKETEELEAYHRRGHGQCTKCPNVVCELGGTTCVARRKPHWATHYPCVCAPRHSRSCPRDHERCDH